MTDPRSWESINEAPYDKLKQKILNDEDEKFAFGIVCNYWEGSDQYKNADAKSNMYKLCCDELGKCTFYTQTWFFLICGGVAFLILIIVIIVVACCCCREGGGRGGGKGGA
ncbi:hypothetical protein B9Z55_007147 [Caenorhabditis nigoni]|nr:hypothetical protein B9Z55_007147 [Caenorhabditis nigoni]